MTDMNSLRTLGILNGPVTLLRLDIGTANGQQLSIFFAHGIQPGNWYDSFASKEIVQADSSCVMLGACWRHFKPRYMSGQVLSSKSSQGRAELVDMIMTTVSSRKCV